MARIRSVHPGLTSDESYMSMSMTCKAAWPILWTECDDHGIFEWKPIVLKARIFPADNVDFSEVLAELVELDCVRQFEVGGKSFGIVRNFGKFQRPKNPSYRYSLPIELQEYACFKAANSSSPSPVLTQSYPTTAEKSPQMKEEGGSRKVRDKSLGQTPRDKRMAEIDLEFSETFWKAYPRKAAKGAAEKAFRSARKVASLDEIMAGVERYAKERSGKDKQFTAHPATWLNAKSWTDEPESSRDRQANGEPSHAFLFGRG